MEVYKLGGFHCLQFTICLNVFRLWKKPFFNSPWVGLTMFYHTSLFHNFKAWVREINFPCSRSIFGESLKVKIKSRLKDELGSKDDSELNTWFEWVEEIVKARHLVAIYDCGEEELDSVILKVLFQVVAAQGRRVDRGMGELKLAIAWNRIDMVGENIFSENAVSGSLSQTDFCYLMPVALSLDRVDFVRAFLENGLNLRNYLSIPQLLLLYNNNVCLA